MKIKLLLSFLTICCVSFVEASKESTCGLEARKYHSKLTDKFLDDCREKDELAAYLTAHLKHCLDFNGHSVNAYQNCYDNYLLNINQFNEDERHGKPNSDAAKRKKVANTPKGKNWWQSEVQRLEKSGIKLLERI